MILYVIAYVACILLSGLGDKVVPLRAATLFCIAVIVSVIVGFRPVDVGIDTQGYYFLYDQALNGFQDTWLVVKVGYVFYYLSVLAELIGGDAAYLTFFYALLTCFFVFYTIYRYSYNLPVSVIFFFTNIGLFFFMHNVMRQALAVSVVFYSVSFIISRHRLRFFLTITVAMLVHASAVFFIPFYFLARLPIKRFVLLLFWVLSLPFIFFTNLIVSFVKSFSLLVPDNYLHYLSSQSVYEAGGVSGFGLVLLLKQGIFWLIWLAYRRGIQVTEDRVIYLLAMCSVILGNFFLGLGLIGRVNEYLFVFILLALPMAIMSLIRKSQQEFALLLTSFLFVVIFFQNLLSGSQGVVL